MFWSRKILVLAWLPPIRVLLEEKSLYISIILADIHGTWQG